MKFETYVDIASDFTARRRRKAERGRLRVPVVIDIPEVAAPVALWTPADQSGITRKAWRRDGESYLMPLKGTTDAPGCRGMHPKAGKKPDGSLGVDEFSSALARKSPESLLGHGVSFDPTCRFLRRRTGYVDNLPLIPSDAKQIDEDGHDVAVAMVDFMARRYALVDGVVHQRRRLLPFLALTSYDGIIEPHLESGLSRDSQEVVSILDLTLSDVKDAHGLYRAKKRSLLLPEIVDRPLLLEDGRGQMILMACASVLSNGIGRNTGYGRLGFEAMAISDAGADRLIAFAELRDAWIRNAGPETLELHLAKFQAASGENLAGNLFDIPLEAVSERVGGLGGRP